MKRQICLCRSKSVRKTKKESGHNEGASNSKRYCHCSATHVSHMVNDSLPNLLPYGTRQSGRLKTWIDNIRQDCLVINNQYINPSV